MDRYFPGRKIITGENSSSSLPAGHQSQPDRPPVISAHVTIDPDPKSRRIKPITILETSPVLPHQEIPIAGRRTIGGGTSTEALRRARKKTRRRTPNRILSPEPETLT